MGNAHCSIYLVYKYISIYFYFFISIYFYFFQYIVFVKKTQQTYKTKINQELKNENRYKNKIHPLPQPEMFWHPKSLKSIYPSQRFGLPSLLLLFKSTICHKMFCCAVPNTRFMYILASSAFVMDTCIQWPWKWPVCKLLNMVIYLTRLVFFLRGGLMYVYEWKHSF